VETFTYTAVFHLPAHSSGGTIQFAYALDHGQSQTPASVTAKPGQTSVTYAFKSTGTLSADHTYPGTAMVTVTSPTQLTSSGVQPSGTCVAQGPYQVTSVTVVPYPTSIAGIKCGTVTTVTYTATFTLAANSPGGTVQYRYTVDNGNTYTADSLMVSPGQTTATRQFTWSGALSATPTYPLLGGVQVQTPNSVNSSLVGPTGTCSP
jgi:hypothetical protein